MPSASDFHQYTSSDTIKIIVGTPPHRKRHNLYTTLLLDKSTFFATKIASLHPNSQTAEMISVPSDDEDDTPETDHVIHLPTLDASAFQQFVQWLYAKPFDVSDLGLVCGTYLLGHEIKCEEMRNDLVDAVRGYYGRVPLGRVDMGVLVRLCEGLPPDGPVYAQRAGNGESGGGNGRGAQGNGDQNQNQNRNRNGNPNGNPNDNPNDNPNGSPRPVEPRKPNKLLELLIAQLTYKVLVRGWDAYKDSASFKALMKSSIEVAMWHLDWLHRLNDSRYIASGEWGGAREKGRKRGKRERERNERETAEGNEGEGAEMFFENKRAIKAKLSSKLEGGGGVGGFENPAALRGCMFHEHKEQGSVCKTPDDLFDDE